MLIAPRWSRLLTLGVRPLDARRPPRPACPDRPLLRAVPRDFKTLRAGRSARPGAAWRGSAAGQRITLIRPHKISYAAAESSEAAPGQPPYSESKWQIQQNAKPALASPALKTWTKVSWVQYVPPQSDARRRLAEPPSRGGGRHAGGVLRVPRVEGDGREECGDRQGNVSKRPQTAQNVRPRGAGGRAPRGLAAAAAPQRRPAPVRNRAAGQTR